MFIRKENRKVICEALFTNGVMWAKKNLFLPRHPELGVPNIEVIKLMRSFKSKEYVVENFNWQTYYWRLTDEGHEFLQKFLNTPSDVVPNTWKAQHQENEDQFGGREAFGGGGFRGRGRGRGYDGGRGRGRGRGYGGGGGFRGGYRDSARGGRGGGYGGGRGYGGGSSYPRGGGRGYGAGRGGGGGDYQPSFRDNAGGRGGGRGRGYQ